jgi:2-polyprenyl-3-methyl-5-hydroxy-6-metoxy-1,4-benzoquinol methylase
MAGAPGHDPKEVVRRGYDEVSLRYRADDESPASYNGWFRQLTERLGPRDARVLDLGCGCGVPLARDLSAAGYRVTGVDISDVQVGRAKRLVPHGQFVRADAAIVEFPAGSFDGVVCLYTIIHIPLHEQEHLLAKIASWLSNGGWLLLTAGHQSWTGTEAAWLGGEAPMWWSQADQATYRRWITHAGLDITEERYVPEGTTGHAMFWARQTGTCPDAAAGRFNNFC